MWKIYAGIGAGILVTVGLTYVALTYDPVSLHTQTTTMDNQTTSSSPEASLPHDTTTDAAMATSSLQQGQGLIITDIVQGTGATAEPGKTVTVEYTGMFQDGTVFDASSRHTPSSFSFTLGTGQVIPGWDQGLVGMKVGGERKLVIPSDLAYGPQGQGPIPPNATLVFDVKLLQVQ